MLDETELERLFAHWKIPSIGRTLVREMRETGPVRDVQSKMTAVRTRYMSKKMGRPLLAESRTCEFPAIYLRDNDRITRELWPQCKKFDIAVRGGRHSRLVHTPDLFVIDDEEGFVIEEWRERKRLLEKALQRPQHVYCDEQGIWHDRAMEEHLGERGMTYRLRCADEHPRILLSNLQFLEDFTLDSSPAVPAEECDRAKALFGELHRVPHLSLVHEHKFKAEHIFQMVLSGELYVNLHETLLRSSDELVIYASEAIAKADALLSTATSIALPDNAFHITAGAKFLYDGKGYEVVLVGTHVVRAREIASGAMATLDVQTIEQLRAESMVVPAGKQLVDRAIDRDALFKESELQQAVARLEWLTDSKSTPVSDRTLRRYRSRIAGITSPQEQLEALMPTRSGNTKRKLPDDAITVAQKVVEEFHNTPTNPKVAATFSKYVARCADAGITGMSRSNFYRWIHTVTDIKAREGRRAAYQRASIPDYIDYKHPVHGVLPHEVCYCDHTIPNVFLKGATQPDLGKPTLTLAFDGAMRRATAFWLSYRPASAVAVLMCLRDYVRRNGRLPRVLVLDNGREFHSRALLQFCSMYRIQIRWRRASSPRDSTLVERMLGVTEQEVISALKGNSLALKDPRNVSSTHHPDKHIAWTLPALHGALDHFLFNIHPNRLQPALQMTPLQMEARSILEHGSREHLLIKFDSTLKLLTAPHPAVPTRIIDRQRGVFVDGEWYWNDQLAQAKKGEPAEVRVELWRASVVYVCFRDNWLIARARNPALDGRHRPEFELQKREEARRSRNAAQKDRSSVANSKARTQLWDPENWDERLREQLCEMYYLYSRLEMTEVLPAAKNLQGELVDMRMPRGSTVELLHATERALLERRQEEESQKLHSTASPGEPATATWSVRKEPAVQANWDLVEPDDADYF